MKKLKILICIVLVIIMILIISILVINNHDNNTQNQTILNNATIYTENDSSIDPGVSDNEINLQYESDNMIKYVQSREEYFAIKKIYNKCLTQIADNNGDTLLKMFSEDYCKENNLNSNNIVESTGIKTISDTRNLGTYTSLISDILTADISENLKIYFVYGKYLLKSTGDIDNFNLMVIVDNSILLYDIYPYSYMIENGYTNLKIGSKVNTSGYKIENRETNTFSYDSISDQEMANNYLNDWKDRYLYDTQSAYEKLNTTYSSERFPNYSDFQTYLNNLGYISQINEYRIYSTTEYTDYVCTDQYNNYYIFRQQGGVMRYTVFLDSYTVEMDTFKQNYEKAEDETKIAIQIGKFKQMLNSKDYSAIYNKLNNTFRQNNYSTVTTLENYLSKNIYDINTITIEDYSPNEDYYVCECLLQNQKNTNEQKNMTIVIKLIDSNNFEMSFSIS